MNRAQQITRRIAEIEDRVDALSTDLHFASSPMPRDGDIDDFFRHLPFGR